MYFHYAGNQQGEGSLEDMSHVADLAEYKGRRCGSSSGCPADKRVRPHPRVAFVFPAPSPHESPRAGYRKQCGKASRRGRSTVPPFIHSTPTRMAHPHAVRVGVAMLGTRVYKVLRAACTLRNRSVSVIARRQNHAGGFDRPAGGSLSCRGPAREKTEDTRKREW